MIQLHSTIEGSGDTLLILHGFLGMGDNWKTLSREFADQGYEVHLIDQRNHGRSPHTDEFNYDLLAQDVANYMKEKQIEKAAIIGHSMGGKVLMNFMQQYPEKISHPIVVDIAPKYYPPHHQQILEGLNHLASMDLSSRSDADNELKKHISHPSIRQFLLKNLYWKEKNKLALRLNLSSLEANIEEIGRELADVTYENPVLFIAGETSDYIKDEDKESIRKQFPKSQIIGIKDAGHWVHAEKKDAFFSTCMAFLKRV